MPPLFYSTILTEIESIMLSGSFPVGLASILRAQLAWIALALCMALTTAYADNPTFNNELNYLGSSGLFFTPSGSSLDYGEFHFSYSSFADSSYRYQVAPGDSIYDGNTYSIASSPFPGLEIGLSNIGYDLSASSDLAANIKYSPTFIPDNWFDLSIGAIDLGGETGTQSAVYGALSKQFGRFRLTAGTGTQKQSNTLARYQGGFAGIEYQPHETLTLLAEHDGANTHYGLRLRTPQHWMNGKTQVFGSVMLGTDLDGAAANHFSLGVRTSLFSSSSIKFAQSEPLESSIKDALPWLFASVPASANRVEIPRGEEPGDHLPLIERLGRLKRIIARHGFEDVWVGQEAGRLFVRFENSIFNRNQIDALGLVLGEVAQRTAEDITDIDITLSRYGVPSLRFSVSAAALVEFYGKGSRLPALVALVPAVKSMGNSMGNALWVGGSMGQFLKPRVSLSPQFRYFLGTELGVFDYSLALRSSVELPLWPGATVSADYDHKVSQTPDFERGRSFYRWSMPSRWTNVELRQVLKLPLNVYGAVGVGQFKGIYRENFDGVFGEALWQSPNGIHQISVRGGRYQSNEYDGLVREVGVGRYRYYWSDLDLSISLEAGQYWRQDRGGRVEFAFNFGDTKAHFFIQDTGYQKVGIAFTAPLGLRRDMAPRLGQLKGSSEVRLGAQTMVNNDSGCNCLVPGRAQDGPGLSYLSRQVFNRDRLSVEYIRVNQARLREAFRLWGGR